MLLGRVTFTEWASYWPTSTDEPFEGQRSSSGALIATYRRSGSRLRSALTRMRLVRVAEECRAE